MKNTSEAEKNGMFDSNNVVFRNGTVVRVLDETRVSVDGIVEDADSLIAGLVQARAKREAEVFRFVWFRMSAAALALGVTLLAHNHGSEAGLVLSGAAGTLFAGAMMGITRKIRGVVRAGKEADGFHTIICGISDQVWKFRTDVRQEQHQ